MFGAAQKRPICCVTKNRWAGAHTLSSMQPNLPLMSLHYLSIYKIAALRRSALADVSAEMVILYNEYQAALLVERSKAFGVRY
jgi:hypothetical protein